MNGYNLKRDSYAKIYQHQRTHSDLVPPNNKTSSYANYSSNFINYSICIVLGLEMLIEMGM